MTKAEALRIFGTQQKLADALGIKDRSGIPRWPDDCIPTKHALAIEYELTTTGWKPNRLALQRIKAAAAKRHQTSKAKP